MKLHITDEFSQLKSVVVCRADQVPHYKDYQTTDQEFIKYHPYSWDKELMRKQQDAFFTVLDRYNVELIFPKTSPLLPFQMYTRDTAFVIGEKLYYAGFRKYGDRNGEISALLDCLQLPSEQAILLHGEIEGGDVVVNLNNSCYLGQTSRTDAVACKELETYVEVRPFTLGDHVMHLDTRLVLLPKNIALIYPKSFKKEDFDELKSRYILIEIYDDEVKKLGTNVFAVDPETLVVPLQHMRVADELKQHKFKLEIVDYTEPINLGGSFRCTTMPLERAD